jgi:Mg/Co/Ni transporter MgtE
MQRFKSELNLSGEQTEKLAMVLGDYRHYYDSLQDQLDDVRATGKKRILQILDQDQRAKFERIMGDLQPQLEKK